MTPLDAMLQGPRTRLDGGRTAGEPARPDAAPGFDAVLELLESRERPEPPAPPEGGTPTSSEPASAPAEPAPRAAGLGALLAGPAATPARPGAVDIAALMERAANRPAVPNPGPSAMAGVAIAAVPSAPAVPGAPIPATPTTAEAPAAGIPVPEIASRPVAPDGVQPRLGQREMPAATREAPSRSPAPARAAA
ncbi:hypothetical protein QR79_31040, partial [Methylobacterium indicum]